MYNYNEDYLMHFGIKGMKWGVRRYQNKDGTLTEKGKKRLSKEYKELTEKAKADIDKNNSDRYIDAYNKAANDMNNGMIDKYNADYAKKLGPKEKTHDYEHDDDYINGYLEMFSNRRDNYYNQMLVDEITNNKHYKKAKDLCDKYGMTNFDDFARENQAEIDEMRKSLK